MIISNNPKPNYPSPAIEIPVKPEKTVNEMIDRVVKIVQEGERIRNEIMARKDSHAINCIRQPL